MKNFLFVLTLLFSLSSFSQSPVDKSFPPEELFALGSYYYPEQWDSSQWERDLKKMSEMGIKFTHFAEFAWSMMEPEEGEWMSFMLPYTIIVLFIAWFILLRLFPFKQKNIELQIEGEAKKDWRSIVVYITFAITVILWMFDKVTGVNSNVVAMIPVAVFCITGVITKRDLEEISWSVLWMVAGGFALGVALQETGLAKHMIEAIPFNTWPPVLMIVGSGLICYAMANFISHTATAALLVPILAIAGSSMRENLSSLGGVETLLIGVAIGSSLAMILPISTPPNALAHATGMIQQKDMEKVGIIMGIIGLILGYTMLIILGSNKLL